MIILIPMINNQENHLIKQIMVQDKRRGHFVFLPCQSLIAII